MDRNLRKSAARLLGNHLLPRLDRIRPLHRGVASLVTATQFRTERRSARGVHRPRVDRPSVIHFSINKSATQFVKRILFAAAHDTGLIPVNFSSYAAWSSTPYLDADNDAAVELAHRAFCPIGHVYSPFGGLVRGINQIDSYRVLLLVRDPRDVLTSEYFSTAFSHPLPGSPLKRKLLLERRAIAKSVGIDHYVQLRAEALLRTYRSYKSLLTMDNVLVTNYEGMIADFQGWLDAILAFTGLTLAPARRVEIVNESRQRANGNVRSKRRQVLPGDHVRQLKPATVRELTSRLEEALGSFGYPPFI